ncbi:MAG: MFS transporter [Planctomycetes bacterium]|nr:MFS transporter [Planctomycetota bacterium]
MHHVDEPANPNSASSPVTESAPWWTQLTRYHWFVLVVAALGWLFDTMDQQLFVLARPAAMKDLVVAESGEEAKVTAARRSQAGDISTSLFIAGWACGGLFFGMLGDRIGRAKTMLITIVLYSLCTGLSALSIGLWDFAFYRFLTGLGVGGEFAVGVALVAEVMPSSARTGAIGLLQALSAVGNITAAFINLGLGIAEEEGLVTSPWRVMFLIGALPALLAVVIRWGLEEPEAWQKASGQKADEPPPADATTPVQPSDSPTGIASGEPPYPSPPPTDPSPAPPPPQQELGSYTELFADPRWRKHAIFGLILGCSGIIGLWSVGFFTPDLIRYVQRKEVAAAVYDEKIVEAKAKNDGELVQQWTKIRAEYEDDNRSFPEAMKKLQASAEPAISGRLSRWSSYTSLMINLGAFFGIYGFSVLAQHIGRKPSFVIALTAAFLSTAAVFWLLHDFWQIFVLVPIMGFCQLSLFGGYAIYFPELFPTRLRSTGTSFCYNVGRFAAALGPLVKTALESFFQGISGDHVQSLRNAGVTMCLVFLVGFFVLPFLPETKDQPLPE